MKIKVEITSFRTSRAYFSLKVESDDDTLEHFFDSCKDISNFLDLDIDTYNERLIKKVIKHTNFKISESTKDEGLYKDIIFEKKDIIRKVYVERFEKEFTSELVLATLGGE